MSDFSTIKLYTKEIIRLEDELAKGNTLIQELLEALELVWNKVLTEYHSKDSPVRQTVEAAIAKAKGE